MLPLAAGIYSSHSYGRIPHYQDVCVQKRRTWVIFWLQGSEMSKNISLKMGIQFAVSLSIV